MMTDAPALSQKEIRQERINREYARRKLIRFAQYTAPWYRAAAHHELVADALEQVARYIETRGMEGIGRLLIFMPPRHGKTELASRMFPAWLLGRNPDLSVIMTSYGADLATANSRKVREYVSSSRYQAIFGERSTKDQPVEISQESRSASAWDLAPPHRGAVVATGVGGGITGRGAHLLVIDDPFKNRDEAESEPHRERVMDWYGSTAYTRLEDGGAIVGMLTRWHQEDWAGQMLKRMAEDPLADQWHVICLPAIAEEGPVNQIEHLEKLRDGIWVGEDPLGRAVGSALWDYKFSLSALESIKANIGEYDWAALYQQRPFLRSGSMFKREWFDIVDAIPEGVQIVGRVRYWDKAGTAGAGARTAGTLLALGSNRHVYVEHVHKGQWSQGQREQEIVRTAQEDRKRPGVSVQIWHEQEPGSAGKDSAQATNRNLALAGFGGRFETVTGDKETRAAPWAAACEGGMVHLIRGHWNRDYIEEHVAFPKGKFKDQVDGSSGAFAKLVSSGGVGWDVF